MSKSVGRIFGTGSMDKYGYEKRYLNYLQNYNTSNYDNTLQNMTAQALDMSSNLSSLPDYQFSVDGSDAARQRAEEATYQAYVDRLTPQYQQQTADMETSLANKGIAVGSEAYQRAMNDLQEKQNNALNQAAYQSVAAGQKAYSQSFNENLANANLNNTARQNYIQQILELLSNSISGYQNEATLYNLQNGIQNRISAVEQSGWNNLNKTIESSGKAAAMLI